MVMTDVLHCMDLGCSQDILGNIMWEAMPVVCSGRSQSALEILTLEGGCWSTLRVSCNTAFMGVRKNCTVGRRGSRQAKTFKRSFSVVSMRVVVVIMTMTMAMEMAMTTVVITMMMMMMFAMMLKMVVAEVVMVMKI